jgi:hypothetical protein
MKKAQSLSLNTIIIAALALLVLVILAFVFMGRFSLFTKESGDCATMKGTCIRSGSCDGTYQKQVSYDCDLDGDGTKNEGQSIDGICCISL